MSNKFCVYGDNIVECERMIRLITEATSPSTVITSGNPTAPEYEFSAASGSFSVATFPGFGRWKNDILKYIKDNGGALREAPDIILTKLTDSSETPVIALEFCNALPAGNQAWQRSGRAYSTAKAGIPYVFMTEIGGYELDGDRNKKAPRTPNPAVPFSYFSYATTSNTQITIAYQMNPGADDTNKALYANSICQGDLTSYLKSLLLGGDGKPAFEKLQVHLIDFVSKLSAKSKQGHLCADDWNEIAATIANTNNTDAIIKKSNFSWKKKISIPTTRTFDQVFAAGRALCQGVASCDLPISILPKERINLFFNVLKKAYGHSADKFESIKTSKADIAICWYAGFKPRGDDARPDRGVLPLARMLLGDKIQIITFIYGPATPMMLNLLEKHPDIISKNNGLWEATLSLSDFIVCDATTSQHPVLQLGFMNDIRGKVKAPRILMPANDKHFPEDDFIGENDVDSIIHLVFTKILGSQCFEMMCNPPGGDWSGISLLLGNDEYRWLTLPRVSASGHKRPDHVIQIKDVILSIESKDFLSNLETNIGPRLNGYCRELFNSQPSCVKHIGTTSWNDDTNDFRLPNLKYTSASAFLLNHETDMSRALISAKTDIIFGVTFRRNYTAIVEVAFGESIDKDVAKLLKTRCLSVLKNYKGHLNIEFKLH